jgi:hypothetical protein
MTTVNLEELFNIYKEEIRFKCSIIKEIEQIKELKSKALGNGTLALSLSGETPADFCSESLINFSHLVEIEKIIYRIVADTKYGNVIYYDLEPI